jgi:hypothetical protein
VTSPIVRAEGTFTAGQARVDVEGESKAVDEGHNDVTSLTHMCAQQLLKWQVPNT